MIAEAGALAGAQRGDGAFAPGPAVWVGTREIAHVDAGGSLDIRLTKAAIRDRRAALKADARVTLKPGSDWIEFAVVTAADAAAALDLIEAAIAANLPDAPAGAPPTGADLQRRRRFH